MKLHRLLAEGCTTVLGTVFKEGTVLDRVLEATFEANPKWGKRDRAFVAETVFEVVRWRRALAFIADNPQPAALCAAQWQRMQIEIPDWWSWEGCRVEEMTARESALADQPRAVRESIPDWLDVRGESELGAQWDLELAALNRRAPIFLRVNRLLGSVEETGKWLESEGILTRRVEHAPDALEVTLGRIGKPLIATGRFEIQDAGSQRIAPLLGVEPGMRVLDLCAGAGGKTLQLAALMENRGEIIALDVVGRKLTELERRAQRARVSIIRKELWGPNTLRSLTAWADRVLIDAPCSGLGTLRRQPDLKWRLTSAALEKARRTQKAMLEQYPELMRAGGAFVYATCSILPTENGGQIEDLIGREPHWAVGESLTVSPAGTTSDGFYAARLAKK